MRGGWLVGLFVTAVLACGVAAVYAADPHADAKAPRAEAGGHAKDGHADGGSHGGGEPDPFKLALDLTIWTVVVFLVLLFVLARFAWRPMLEGLQKREQNILAALEDAQRARDEAEALRRQLKQEMDHASDKVRAMLEEARRDAQHTKDELIAEGRKEVQAEKERARREIELAKDQALQELWNTTADLATTVAARAIGRGLGGDDQRRLVEEALAELPRAHNPRRN